MDYNGRHIWIIGASSGIGRALALELARRGACLTLSARNETALRELAGIIGANARVCPLDVTDSAAVTAVATAFPRIDTMIYLAATYAPGTVAAARPQDIRTIIETNLIAAFSAVQAVLPIMHAQSGGQIALCGSVAGYRGLPNGQPYSATKAAIISLAESLRSEEGPRNIDIRLISPGFVDTPMTQKNPFPMPMMIKPDRAARAIAEGLQGKSFEIHFPRRMTWPMKLLRILPAAIYFKIAARL